MHGRKVLKEGVIDSNLVRSTCVLAGTLDFREGHGEGVFQKRLKNTINMIFNWGIESKIIRGVTHSPVYGLKIVLKEDKKPEILKLDELRLLLREARERGHPWYSIWATALLTGMRNGELYALKWSDLDLEKGLITVQRPITSE